MASHDITSIDLLRGQLFKAIQLEHATIPPYTSALYSIHEGCNAAAVEILRVVVVEEMLHLSLAANLMNAVGGTVDLTVPDFVPSYPTVLPDGENDFSVGLGPFSEEALKTFLKIERPAMVPQGKQPHLPRSPAWSATATHLFCHPQNHTLRYYSIGEFYAAIKDGLVYLESQKKGEGKDKTIFIGDPAKQVASEYYYNGGGELFPITDIETAVRAIDLIIEQGEGEVKDIYGAKGEIAHYYRFDQLAKNKYYQKGDKPDHPTGPALHIDWKNVWPVAPNLKLKQIPKSSDLHDAAAAFNKAYREFLQFLTRAFNGNPQLLREAVPRMFEFRKLVRQLICNPLPETDYHAAPTYEI